jgi:hypothetical protein
MILSLYGFLHSDKAIFKFRVLADVERGELICMGHVSGFSDKAMKDVHKLLWPLVIHKKPVEKHGRFDVPVSGAKPIYKCNVRFTEITDDGILRHPIFERMLPLVMRTFFSCHLSPLRIAFAANRPEYTAPSIVARYRCLV